MREDGPAFLPDQVIPVRPDERGYRWRVEQPSVSRDGMVWVSDDDSELLPADISAFLAEKLNEWATIRGVGVVRGHLMAVGGVRVYPDGRRHPEWIEPG